MNNISINNKVEALKKVLRKLHEGADPVRLREEFAGLLSQVSPAEIPLLEQELVREGVPINEILRLCDLHVELFRRQLESQSLTGVPRGHPLDLLMRENEVILKEAEALGLYAAALRRRSGEAESMLEQLRRLAGDLKRLRIHYRKIQMLIFPYLERRGLVAVPRVLWGREDQALSKIRRLAESLAGPEKLDVEEVASLASEISWELAELVFRENKILYPALWALLSEGEWAAIAQLAGNIGYLVEPEVEWRPSARPLMPYEISGEVSPGQVERMPPELRNMARRGLRPDNYEVRRGGDIELATGFIGRDELEGLLESLPLEITYANADDRIKLFSKSRMLGGFPRARTIVGRRIEFCHPPRLEGLVKKTVDELKRGEREYAEFWTRKAGRILRVLIAPVRNSSGEYLGTVEIVEDFTEILENPEGIKEKIVVL